VSHPAELVPPALLAVLVEGTSGATGIAFFRDLTKSLVEALTVEGAWVTEYLPEQRRLRSLAFRLRDNWVPGYEYAIEGTPCAEVVLRRELVLVPDRVLEAFPREHDLRKLGGVSYIGAPLLDEAGERVLGHLGAFSARPLPDTRPFRQVFQLFVNRAGAELRRLRLDRELRGRNEELEAVLESALDAILILDSERTIVRANSAAGRLLGCHPLNGTCLDDYLPEGGPAALAPLFAQALSGGSAAARVWIPPPLELRPAGSAAIAAEGTLSKFVLHDRPYFTLILRNLAERLAAEARIAELSHQAAYWREEIERHFGEIVGESPAMRQVLRDIREVARTDAAVLITGETGTGKELVARAVHRASRRAAAPLVTVNVAAIPANLVESEFFGHERGAFTGATARREGRFAYADGGTLFLDEIGELPLELQAKLLRVLQEGEFEPVGSGRTRKVDVRIVAATNRDLLGLCAAGRFREDLYYRLSVFPLHVPALRHRGDDVVLLAREFVRRFSRRDGRPVPELKESDLRRLRAYAWPGNVRELANVIERGLITGEGRGLNLDRALPAESTGRAAGGPEAPVVPAGSILTAGEMQRLEIANLRRALAAAGGRVSGVGGAADLLGLKPSTLSSRLKALGLR
jgi:DNA-binding NtrC family response regulator